MTPQLLRSSRNTPSFAEKTIRYTYYAIGGIYFASEVSTVIKVLWFCFCITVAVPVCFVGTIGYLLTVEEADSYDIVSAIWSIGNVSYFLICLPLITYTYRNEFDMLFSYLDEHRTLRQCCTRASEKNNDVHKFGKIDAFKMALFWSVSLFSVLLVFGMLGITDALLLRHESNAIRDTKHHLIRAPYMCRISTAHLSYLLVAVEYPSFLLNILICACQNYFITVITAELNNIAVNYCHELRTSALRLFGKSFSITVRKHQLFRKRTRTMLSYLEILNGVTVVPTILGLLHNLYTVLTCNIGEMFETMQEALNGHVYNLPWYDLPPKKRIEFYILLCQVQRAIEFNVLKVYPVNLQMVPKVLKASYSYANFIMKFR